MVKKNNGFTLIEVLAVIIILGAIVAIVVPSMLERIEKSKQNSAKSSMEFYIDALQKASVFPQTPGKEIVIGGTYDITTLSDKVDLDKSYSKPTSGYVVIDDEGIVISASLCVNNYKVDFLSGISTVDAENTCADIVLPDTTPSDGFNFTKGVNTPVLGTGMTPIKWDVSNNEIVTTVDDADWYDYANKKWANAKTADGSYWVWIPRYAYKITDKYHNYGVGTVSIKFLEGLSNRATDVTKIETSGYVAGTKDTSSNYFVHPSFDFDGAILGYWVAKFEASVANHSDLCYGTASESEANCAKTTLVPKIIPNARSWRYNTINNFFTVALNMKDNSTYGWLASEVDTHMIKNTEWAGVTYLSQSTYGKNSKVWTNNNGYFVTGCAGDSYGAAMYANLSCYAAYNTTGGFNASTTGNITGIYDMTGGSAEYTAAYVNNNSTNLNTYGSNLLNAASRYKNVYSIGATDSQANNYIATSNLYGDNIYETSASSSGYNSWNASFSTMIYGSNFCFIRGNNRSAGVWSDMNDFQAFTGKAYIADGFRPAVVVNK